MQRILRVLDNKKFQAGSQEVSEKVLKLLDDWKTTPCIVGGYLPLAGEILLTPLWKPLLEAGFWLSLPLIHQQKSPLVFAQWTPGDPLRNGPLGTKIPCKVHLVRPSVLFVPFLSFDERGYRLGRGGGFYDATIHLLRQAGVQAIGIGLEVQKEKSLPREPHDQPLDAVVTEKQVYVWL